MISTQTRRKIHEGLMRRFNPAWEAKMLRFRPDNTEGYSSDDLAALNDAFETIMANNPPTDGARGDTMEEKLWQDNVAEKLLARYDAGERGDSLTR